jgi:hypothetical protein
MLKTGMLRATRCMIPKAIQYYPREIPLLMVGFINEMWVHIP